MATIFSRISRSVLLYFFHALTAAFYLRARVWKCCTWAHDYTPNVYTQRGKSLIAMFTLITTSCERTHSARVAFGFLCSASACCERVKGLRRTLATKPFDSNKKIPLRKQRPCWRGFYARFKLVSFASFFIQPRRRLSYKNTLALHYNLALEILLTTSVRLPKAIKHYISLQ